MNFICTDTVQHHQPEPHQKDNDKQKTVIKIFNCSGAGCFSDAGCFCTIVSVTHV